MLVSTNGNAPQTYTNTLSLGTTPVTAGASYRISANPGGRTPEEISVDPATGEVTFTKALYDKMTPSDLTQPTGPPALIIIEAAYQDQKASYTFTVTDHFSKRSLHTSVVMENDIYVIGGVLRNSGVSGGRVISEKRSDEVWRSSDGGLTWDQAASGPRFLPRGAHSSVVSGNDIYVIAGLSGTSSAVTGSPSRDVWKSDNRGVTWQRVTDNAGFPPRSGHRSEVLNGKIYVIAGQSDSAALDDVWEFDTAGGTWSETTSGSTEKFSARRNPVSAVLGQGAAAKLYLIGGYSSTANYLSDVWNSNSGASWAPVSVTPPGFSPGRSGHSSALLNEGAHRGLYLIGGDVSGGSIVKDVWKSDDGEGKVWTRITQNAEFGLRSGHSSVVQGDALYVIGGSSSGLAFHNDVWRSADGGASWVNVHAKP